MPQNFYCKFDLISFPAFYFHYHLFEEKMSLYVPIYCIRIFDDGEVIGFLDIISWYRWLIAWCLIFFSVIESAVTTHHLSWSKMSAFNEFAIFHYYMPLPMHTQPEQLKGILSGLSSHTYAITAHVSKLRRLSPFLSCSISHTISKLFHSSFHALWYFWLRYQQNYFRFLMRL